LVGVKPSVDEGLGDTGIGLSPSGEVSFRESVVGQVWSWIKEMFSIDNFE